MSAVRGALLGAVLLLGLNAHAAPPKAKKKTPAPDAGVAVDAGQARTEFEWSVPDVLEVVPVDGEMESMGIPVRASAVRTKLKGEPLVQHFAKLFRDAGFLTVPPKELIQLRGLPQITGYDPDTRISYTAMFQANPDGTTTVILTEADLAAQKPPSKDESLPLPEDAKSVVRAKMESSQVLSFQTREKPDALLARFKAWAESAGMAETEPGHYEKGDGFVEVHAVDSNGITRVSVVDHR